eukprot:3982733-Pyramimonas_sp.AAC.1
MQHHAGVLQMLPGEASNPACELALALEPDELCGTGQVLSCSYTSLSVRIDRCAELRYRLVIGPTDQIGARRDRALVA